MARLLQRWCNSCSSQSFSSGLSMVL